jgi:nudix-type nucleoside diphosphatase (YffH/AdpP family)
VRLISRRRVFDDFLKIDEGVVRIGDQHQRRLSLERGDSAAAIVLRSDDNRVLFTRQFRFPAMEKGPAYVLEIPAGVVEPGEDPEECIRRELLEELGYRADHLEPIATFYVSPGGSSERIHLFFAAVSASGRLSAGGGVAAEGEDIEVIEISATELPAMLAKGEIVDAKTLVATMWLQGRLSEMA